MLRWRAEGSCRRGRYRLTELVFLPRGNSIVIRLLGQQKFVDRAKNFIVPLSNEFGPQAVVMVLYFFPIRGLLTSENAIFAVLGCGANLGRASHFASSQQGAVLLYRRESECPDPERRKGKRWRMTC
jgi:hypothetical protein